MLVHIRNSLTFKTKIISKQGKLIYHHSGCTSIKRPMTSLEINEKYTFMMQKKRLILFIEMLRNHEINVKMEIVEACDYTTNKEKYLVCFFISTK